MPQSHPAHGAPAIRPMVTMLLAGLVAGVLDIIYVHVYFYNAQADPLRILKGIAAGLLGPSAAKGGNGTAALGLAIHFCIALAWAALFYLASRKIRLLTRHAVISGVGFGVLAWLVMNLVVLPLDANPPRQFPAPRWMPVFVAHIICVGLPIAWIVRVRESKRT